MYLRRTSMTRCEQKKNEMIPAAAGKLVAQGGVAKLEGGELGSASVFPVSPARETGEFRNDLAKSGAGEAGDPETLDQLPHAVLTTRRGRPAALTPQLQE